MFDTFDDFSKIVINEVPLIDVRAPIEYQKGAFPNTVNLPLMNDKERHLVGVCYTKKGRDKAIELGHQLVSGKKRETRLNAWKAHLEKHPNSIIYCFRGGMRSQISQQWIFQATGKKVQRLYGGYKAFRSYLGKASDPTWLKSTPLVIGGYTGSGKTRLIRQLKNAIDLEGIANHRGSAFGGYLSPQPTQIQFENSLAYALIQHQKYRYMIFEDEGNYLGKCFIPKPIYEYFSQASVVFIDLALEDRVQMTMDEYVVQSQADYMTAFGREQGLVNWHHSIISSMIKLKKRLGGTRFKELSDAFESAFNKQLGTGDITPHENWITFLLDKYYDPLYAYQTQRQKDRILFHGKPDEVLGFIRCKTMKNSY